MVVTDHNFGFGLYILWYIIEYGTEKNYFEITGIIACQIMAELRNCSKNKVLSLFEFQWGT